jgi:hypothetical protein
LLELRGRRRQRIRKFGFWWQSFEEAMAERYHRIGDTRLPEASRSRVAGGQDQTLHIITITI